MAATVPAPAARRSFQGVAQIVRYNWTFYILAGTLILGGAMAVTRIDLPEALRVVVLAGLGLGFYWIAASLIASYYVYDYSPLYKWAWIAGHIPPGRRWANIHSGLDETTPALREMYPDGEFSVIDIYDPLEMTEASIKRARNLARPIYPATPATYELLPLTNGDCDTIFLIFAAHEIRRPESRVQFFAELRRSLAANGHVLIVEHLRNVPNFLAFGPGAFHFLPRSEWLRLAAGAGLRVAEEFRITPLVRVFHLQRTP